MSINLSFNTGSHRLTLYEWYSIAGPDGTVERDEINGKDLGPNEREAYGKLTIEDSRYQKKYEHKSKFTEPTSYSYEDYLRFRIAFSSDDPTRVEMDMAKLKLMIESQPDFYANGNFKSGKLHGDQTYLGFKMAGSRATLLFYDGWIDFAYLAEDQEITVGDNKLMCRAGTEIQGHANEKYEPKNRIKLVTLSYPQYISWTYVAGKDKEGKDIIKTRSYLADAQPVTFHENGKPRQFALAKDHLIVNVNKDGIFEP